MLRSNTAQQIQFKTLFAEGWELYCTGEFHAAIDVWADAHLIKQTNKIAKANLRLVRKSDTAGKG